jgi:hypothetical protein
MRLPTRRSVVPSKKECNGFAAASPKDGHFCCISCENITQFHEQAPWPARHLRKQFGEINHLVTQRPQQTGSCLYRQPAQILTMGALPPSDFDLRPPISRKSNAARCNCSKDRKKSDTQENLKGSQICRPTSHRGRGNRTCPQPQDREGLRSNGMVKRKLPRIEWPHHRTCCLYRKHGSRPATQPQLQIFGLQIDSCFDAKAIKVGLQPLVGAFTTDLA